MSEIGSNIYSQHFITSLVFFLISYALASLIQLLLAKKAGNSKMDLNPYGKIVLIGICIAILYSLLEMLRVSFEVISFKALIFGISISIAVFRYFSIPSKVGEEIVRLLIGDLLRDALKRGDKGNDK